VSRLRLLTSLSGLASLPADDPLSRSASILGDMDPRERLRKRVTDPLEQLAQRVAERVLDLVIEALDINALIARLDLNAVLDRIDVARSLERVDINALLERLDLNALLQRVDVNVLLEHVDINALAQRIDVDALVSQTDFGEIIAKQTSGIASGAMDAVRGQAVGLDGAIDRGVWRLVRRNASRPAAPELLRSPGES
jgi:hypothetical protein